MASVYTRSTSALLFGLATVSMVSVALLASGCAQEDGGAGADVAGGQDTAGQLSDTAAPVDIVSAVDTATASDSGVVHDAGAKSDTATPPDTASAPDAMAAQDATAQPDTASKPDTASSQLRWFQTCGDPVCSGWKTKPNVPLCTGEKTNDPCTSPDGKCDPKNGCNAILICAEKDPKSGPGGCPISARRFKEGIIYLDHAAEAGLRDELLQLPLATWRYRHSNRARRTLGYILEDAPRMPASDMGRERVDVYALSTMTVAAIKAQQREMRALRAELAALRAACAARK